MKLQGDPGDDLQVRRWLIAAGVLCIVGIVSGLVLPSRALTRVGPFRLTEAFDSGVFYCAAKVVALHEDPYAKEPLGTCERTTFPNNFVAVTAPAPQPEYVLAAMAPISVLPADRFQFIWIFVLLGLAVASSGILARLTGFPAFAIFAALIVGPGYENLYFGQLSMFVVLGISASALLLRSGRARASTLALTLALAEPHVALPAFVSMFVLVPRSRATVGTICAVMLAVSFAVFGAATTFEYFTRVLAVQAIAEASNVEQYSATILASLAGLSDRIAVGIGEVQYAVLAVVAILTARALRIRTGDVAFVVAIPAAAAVIGGPFMHSSELIAIWPALLLLSAQSRGRMAFVACVAVALLAYPWREDASVSIRLLVDAVVCFVGVGVALQVRSRRFATWLLFTIPTIVAGFALQQLPLRPVKTIVAPAAAYLRDVRSYAELSPVAWGAYLRVANNVLTVKEIGVKAPTLVLFVCLLVLAIAIVRSGTKETATLNVPLRA